MRALAFLCLAVALLAGGRAGGGAPADAGREPAGDRVIVPMPADPGDGSWLLSWRVVSADGHPVGGSYVFSIGVPSAVADAPAAGSARAAVIGRGLLTLESTVTIGAR